MGPAHWGVVGVGLERVAVDGSRDSGIAASIHKH
jgi:hypothetical protein